MVVLTELIALKSECFSRKPKSCNKDTSNKIITEPIHIKIVGIFGK